MCEGMQNLKNEKYGFNHILEVILSIDTYIMIAT